MEFLRVSPQFSVALGVFLRRLQGSGDERFFHPHPLNELEAQRICAMQTLDFYCVSVVDEKIIGYGMLRGWSEGYQVPSIGIAVDPDLRGIGLGKAMMLYLHVVAELMGANTIRLSVHPDNPAVHLYRKLGYEFGDCGTSSWVGFCKLGNRRRS
jgi:ribosomal-protein-alanine N-acetyltransferase